MVLEVVRVYQVRYALAQPADLLGRKFIRTGSQLEVDGIKCLYQTGCKLSLACIQLVLGVNASMEGGEQSEYVLCRFRRDVQRADKRIKDLTGSCKRLVACTLDLEKLDTCLNDLVMRLDCIF